MSEHTPYGFDPLLQRWVLRDEMRGMNIKVFSDEKDATEERIRIRLSPKKFAEMIEFLRKIEWKNEVRFERDMDASTPRVGEDGPPELVPALTPKAVPDAEIDEG